MVTVNAVAKIEAAAKQDDRDALAINGVALSRQSSLL